MPNVSQIDLIRAIARLVERRSEDGINTRQLNAIIEAADLIVAAFAREHQPAVPGSGLAAWLACDETGMSSRAMARRLAAAAGLPHPVPVSTHDPDAHPADPSDFGRCVNLLEAVPELRPHLPAMADVSPAWGRMVAAWDELEALYREERPSGQAPKLLRRMTEVRFPEDAAKPPA